MSYPVAPGTRDIGAITMRYIPAIYSGKMLVKFYARTVIAAITNADWEGEIKAQGDTVYIRAIPTITSRAHTKGQTLVHEQPTATPVTFLVDKGQYWAFSTDDVDDAQTDIKAYTDRWTEAAAKDQAVEIDTLFLADVYSDAHASNQGNSAGAISGDIELGLDGGTSIALTAADVIEKIMDCGQVLDEQNVPPENRWMVIPAWMGNMIKTSDLKNAYMTGDTVSPTRNGQLGIVDTFMLFKSNLLATTADGSANTTTCIIFGTNDAITFATQLIKNENMPNPFSFGTLFRGLQVYGYKVVKPEALGWLYARKG